MLMWWDGLAETENALMEQHRQGKRANVTANAVKTMVTEMAGTQQPGERGAALSSFLCPWQFITAPSATRGATISPPLPFPCTFSKIVEQTRWIYGNGTSAVALHVALSGVKAANCHHLPEPCTTPGTASREEHPCISSRLCGP